MPLRPEQRIRSRAIQHAEKLADSTNGVITVLRYGKQYDFGCAYVDNSTAIYNALPTRYWQPHMAEYRRGMPSYQIQGN